MVEIVGNASQFKRSLEEATASTNKANSGFQKFGRTAGVVGLALTGVLAYGLDKSVKAAMEAQVSTSRLTNAFRDQHIAIGPLQGAIDGLEAKGRQLGFANTETRDSLGSLITATRNYGVAAKELTSVQDLARFKGISLADATKMVTMAMTGSQRAIKQLGINVSPVTAALDKLKAAHEHLVTVSHKHSAATTKLVVDHAFFQSALGKSQEAQAKINDKMATGNAIMAALHDRIHGVAGAFSHTAAGEMQQFHAQLTGLEESLGKALLPAITAVSEKLAEFAGYLTKHKVLAEALVIGLGGLAVALIGVSVATNLANLAFLASPVGAVIAGFVLLGAGIYELITHWKEVKKAMEDVWNWIENTFLTAWHDTLRALEMVFDWAKKNWPLLLGILTGPIGLAVEQIATHWGTIQKDAAIAWGAIKSFFKTTIGDIAGFFTGLPQDIVDAITGAFGILEKGIKDLFSWKTIVGWIKDALGFGSPSPHFMAIGHDMIESIIHGAGAAAGLLKSAVERIALDVMSSFPGSPTAHPSPRGGGPGLGGSGGLVPQVTEALGFARAHGWHGVVTSGFRTYAEQAALYDKYLHGGPLAAPPGHSSHELGQAVDVTDYQQFGQIMAIAPGFERLYNRLGAADPVHYSVSGYGLGGTVPGPIGQPQVAIVHGGETITPAGASSGLGGDVHVHFSGPVYADERGIRELTDKVSRELYRKQKRNTTLGFR